MKEIEVLVELNTAFDDAQLKLKHLNYIGAKATIDYYYFDPLRQQLKLNSENKLMECCRIRQKGDKAYVTYKVDIYEGKIWQYSDEYETEVKDINALKSIFRHLGLELLVTVNSTKHIYSTDNFEVVLEQVAGLGNFLEVEYQYHENSEISLDQIKKGIYDFIAKLKLDVGEELNSGKPELLLIQKL